MPVINGVIIVESDDAVQPDTIYFLERGSSGVDPAHARTVNLLPGYIGALLPKYYVNPKQCAMLTNIKP